MNVPYSIHEFGFAYFISESMIESRPLQHDVETIAQDTHACALSFQLPPSLSHTHIHTHSHTQTAHTWMYLRILIFVYIL